MEPAHAKDNLSRLLSVLHQSGSTTLDGASYTVDKPGNRTAKTDQYANVTSNYTYDPIYELTQVTQATNTTESYTFDAVGNRLSSLGVPSYTNNSSNELTSTPSTTYDSNGNTLTKVVGSNTTTYAWDFENRLTSVTLPGSGGTVSFAYDPFGRRIKKVTSTTTSIFAYDGDNLIEESNASGTAVARYEPTQNIDEPLAVLRSGATSYFHADGLGSITSLSSSAGSIANTYDSFGKLTASTGSLVNPFQYTARESDTETGLYYYRARYYDPAPGRFLSEDSIRFDAGPNFYSYVGNHPGLFTDPYGASPCPPQKKCGIKKAPEYGVSGAVPGGTTFAWGAEFLNDATHDPKCCEVRQLISWNNALNGVPHEGFPGGLQAGGWYEDRDQAGKRYGRRTGPYSDPIPGIDDYHGNGYNGKDQPSGYPPGVTFRFRLIVVDKCSGGETIYTSKTISVNF